MQFSPVDLMPRPQPVVRDARAGAHATDSFSDLVRDEFEVPVEDAAGPPPAETAESDTPPPVDPGEDGGDPQPPLEAAPVADDVTPTPTLPDTLAALLGLQNVMAGSAAPAAGEGAVADESVAPDTTVAPAAASVVTTVPLADLPDPTDPTVPGDTAMPTSAPAIVAPNANTTDEAAKLNADGMTALAEATAAPETLSAAGKTAAPVKGDAPEEAAKEAAKAQAIAEAGPTLATPKADTLPSAARLGAIGQPTAPDVVPPEAPAATVATTGEAVSPAGRSASGKPPVEIAAERKPEPAAEAKPEGPKLDLARAFEQAVRPATPPPTPPQTLSANGATMPMSPTQAQAQTLQVPMPLLAVTIAQRARSGERHLDIRLDPPELGRIDVELSIDKNGTATTRLSVERMDTLDLLQRDAKALERALNQAGFKTDDQSLSFDLRDNGKDDSRQAQTGQGDGSERRGTVLLRDEGIENGPTLPPVAGSLVYGRGFGSASGLDLRV